MYNYNISWMSSVINGFKNYQNHEKDNLIWKTFFNIRHTFYIVIVKVKGDESNFITILPKCLGFNMGHGTEIML